MSRYFYKSAAILVWIFLVATQVQGQSLTFTSGLTASQLADVLKGSSQGITITGASPVTGVVSKFNLGSGSYLDMHEGVFLTTGSLTNAVGPKVGSSTSGAQRGDPGDTRLQNVLGVTTRDASVLEFTFVPTGTSVSFRYAFASDEYDEYVCSTVNDGFALLLSGAGISTTTYPNGYNIARTSSSEPVSINTINDQEFGGEYGNPLNCTRPYAGRLSEYETQSGLDGDALNFDGYTKVLVAQYNNLVPCTPYTLRVVIADALDDKNDSGIFLEAGTFSTPTPAVTLTGVTDHSFCQGSTVTLTAPASINPDHTDAYQWYKGTTVVGTTRTLELAPAIAGTYKVVVTPYGCTSTLTSDNIVLTQDTKPAKTLTYATNSLCTANPLSIAVATTTGASYLWSNGATTPTISVTAAGDYQVTVSKGACQETSQTVHVTDNTLTSGIVATNISCNGITVPDGSITLNPANGKPPYKANWDHIPGADDGLDPLNNLTATGSPYHVLITDANGCTKSETVSIVEPAPLNPAMAVVAGSSAGTASVNNVSGGTPGYTYQWIKTGGGVVSTTASATNLAAGDYTVKVTDSRGCFKTLNYTEVDGCTFTESSRSFIHVSCPGLTNGSINVTLSETSGVTYAWLKDNVAFATTKNISDLGKGTYQLEAVDAAGCKVFITQEIKEPLLTLTAGGLAPRCHAGFDGKLTSEVSGVNGLGQTADYSYVWTNSLGATVGTEQDLETGTPGAPIKADTYNILVYYTFANGDQCTMNAPVVIGEPGAFSYTLTKEDIKCKGELTGKITLSINGGTPPYSVNWLSDVDGYTSPPFTTNPQIQSGLGVGNYTLTVIKDATNTCVATETSSFSTIVPITEPADELVINSLTQGSTRGTVVLDVTGGTGAITYLWSNGSTAKEPNNLQENVLYTVTATDANGCTKQASITLTANGCHLAAQVAGTPVGTTCFGGNDGSITINITTGSGSGAYTYTWTVPEGQTVPTIEDPTGLKAGTYSLVITDTEDGCASTLNDIKVTQPNQIVNNKTILGVACHDQSNGAITIDLTTGGTQPFTYNWTSTSPSFSSSSKNLTGLLGRTYHLTVTDSKGCTEEEDVVVTNPDVLSVSFASTDVVCFADNNATITPTPAGGWSPYTYAWTNSGSFTSAQKDLTGLAPDTYNLKVTDARACTLTVSKTVVQPSAALSATQTHSNVTCHGGANGSITLTPTGGTPGSSPAYTYSWTLFGAVVSTDQNPTGLKAGTYTLTLTDSKSCTFDLDVTLTEPAAPPVSSLNQNSCVGSPATVVLTTDSGKTSYQWYKVGSGGSLVALTDASATTYSLSIASATTAAGEYVVKVNNGTCDEYSDKFKIAIDPPPTAQIDVDPNRSDFCNGQTVTLTSHYFASDHYEWQLDNVPLSQTTKSITVTTGGVYKLIVHNRQCFSSDGLKTITYHAPFTLTSSKTDVTCPDGTNGSATAIPSSSPAAVPTVHYVWKNASNATVGTDNAVLSSVAAGVYTVTATDAAGCIATTSATVVEPAFTVVPTITNVSCAGGSNGSISLAITTPSFGACSTIVWKNASGTTVGSGGTSVTGLPAGTYTANFTCGACSLLVRSYTITEPSPLANTFTTVQPLCNGQKGSITAGVLGGTPGYTYSWSSGQTTGSLTNLNAGSYTLTITDSKSCTLTTAAVVIVEPTAVTATITAFENPSCVQEEDGSVTALGAGGTPGYTYSWSNGKTTAKITDVGVNTYTVTVKDANLCTATASKTLTAGACSEDNMVLTLEATRPSCEGKSDGRITMTLTGGVAPFTYDWSHIGGNDNGPAAGGVPEGTFQLKVTDSHSPKKHVVTQSVTVLPGIGVCPVLCSLTVVPTIVNATCNGTSNGSISLTFENGTAPYRVDWDHIVGNDDGSSISGLHAGSYKAVVKDASGCFYTLTPYVGQPDIAQIYASQRTVCPGNTVTLTSSYATGNLWSTTSTDRSIQVGAGTYSLSISTVPSCSTATETITITEKTDCTTKSSSCDPAPFPTIPIVNTCGQEQINLALVAAQHNYSEYLSNVKDEFRHSYISKCLSSYEQFGMNYKDKEHHYTLYYYDQGGNLVRTVPPEGVTLITADESMDSIRSDRSNKTRTVFTKHKYPTTYTYNSLGQLTAQNMPDHRTMHLESQTNLAGISTSGIPSGLTITSTQFTEGGQGVLTAYNPSTGKGYLFTTKDEGKSWSALSKIGTMNLRDLEIEYLSGSSGATVAYVIGDDGVFLKSKDNGLNWTLIPTGVDADFISMDFSDQMTGVAFDKIGRLYKTTDGATTWQLYTGSTSTDPILERLVTASDATLTDITFGASGAVKATLKTATSGIVLQSTDHGDNWSAMTSFRTNELKAVQMLNASMAVGLTAQGMLLNSSNGGQNWTTYPSFIPSGVITEIHFRSLSKGIVLSSGKIYFTNDQGKTWNEPSSLGANNTGFLHLEIRKEDYEGYAFTSDMLYRTTDGGFSWTALEVKVREDGALVPLVSFEAVTSIRDYNNSSNLTNKLFVAGKTASNTGSSLIYQYRPNPEVNEPQWIALDMSDLPSGYFIQSMHFVSDDNTASILLTSGELYQSSNYSALSNTLPKTSVSDWSPGATYASGKMKFTDELHGVIITSGSVYTTVDAGNFWEEVSAPGFSGAVTSADFAFSGTSFFGILSQAGSADGGLIYSSINAASPSTWSEVGSFCVPPALEAVSIDPSSGLACAVGSKGTVALQVNSSSWKIEETLRDSKAQENLLEVAYAGSTVVAAGEKGTILYKNSGTGWNVKQVTGAPSLDAVAFDASAHVYVGGTGILAKADVSDIDNITTLAGVSSSTNILTLEFDKDLSLAAGENGKILIPTSPSTWTCVTDEEPEPLYASDMADNSVGYAVGQQGTVLKTTDGGKTWKDINSVTDKKLTAVSFVSAEIGIVVGENGTLKRTKNGGLDKFSDVVTISPAPTGVTFTGVQMVDVNYAIAVGFKSGSTADGLAVIYESTDNGVHWTTPTLVNGGFGLNAVHFPDASFGLAVGNKGTLVRVTIGTSGHVYTNINSASSLDVIEDNKLLSVNCVDRETAYIGSTSGKLFKTINGGTTWNPVDNDVASGDLLSVNFTNRTNGFLAGTNSTLGELVDENDLYSGKFWYDELGRLTVSQNAKQCNAVETIEEHDYQAFSYTLYDDLGRITEVGELLMSTDKKMSDYTTLANAGQLKKDKREQFIADAYLKRQVTRTSYDEAPYTIPGFYQDNLRNRVASVTYSEDGTVESSYDHASHFSYDIHGNVKTLVQDYRKMATDHSALADQRYKKMTYEYDLVSGNVNKVSYQAGKQDQFYHKYQYDGDNRITQVLTSNNGFTWDKDAKYSYYDHGPLARAEIGDQKVQAMDYAYTLQGWIKGVNSETLNSSRDMGKDGLSGNLNQYVGSDASGYTLAYFNGDYAAIGGTSAQTFMASVTGNTALATDTKDLYNGNISRMVTAMTNAENDLTARAVLPRMTSYKYDQLNRIKQVKSYEDINFSTNTWGNNNNDSYKETFAYDSNGNITDLTRNQKYIGTGTPVKLDDMHYNYEKIGVDASYKKYTNKLRWVDETVTTAGINDDIEDQTKDNYEYDDIGNLTYDRKEEIDQITWTVYGKVKEVKRCSTSTKYDLEFLYDATGKRIAKIKKPAATKADATTWTTTWYMHDATGNVMATYEYKNPLSTDKFCLKEQMIYGSSRLGICQVDLNLLTAGTTLSPLSERILGNKYYEQSNHLGNVLTVVSDKKIPYDAQGQNLVVNGTFESSTAGLGTNWIWPNSSYIGTPSIVSGNGFTSSAQRVDIPTGKTRIILRNLITTTPGKQYKLTFKHRSSNGFNVNGNAALSWYQNIAANTGSAQTVSYVVTTNANSLGVEFDMNKSAGDWLEIDDISLTLLDPDAAIDFYQASVISTSDYYAFGSPIYDRTHYASEYKYGFNGKEKDDEGDGGGGATYDYGFRIYNPNLGRFLSVDPLSVQFPWNSSYSYAENDVIRSIDLDGREKLALSGACYPDQVRVRENDPNPNATGYYQNQIDGFYKQTLRLHEKYGFTAQKVFNGKDVLDALKNETLNHGPIEYFSFFGHTRGSKGLFLSKDEGFYTGNSGFAESENDANMTELLSMVKSGDIKFAKNALVLLAGCNTATDDGVNVSGITGAFGARNSADEFAMAGATVIAARNGHVVQQVENVSDGRLKISDDDPEGEFVKITATPIYGVGRNSKKIVDYKIEETSLGRSINVDDYLGGNSNNNSSSKSKSPSKK